VEYSVSETFRFPGHWKSPFHPANIFFSDVSVLLSDFPAARPFSRMLGPGFIVEFRRFYV